jgi:1-acyl-sn-glycerol-3-phosphate acyltransferase
MKYIKLIFGRIWAIWGLIVFAGSLLLLLPLVVATRYMKEPKKSTIFYKISKLWMRIFLWGTGCPLKVVGKAHFKKGETYIVTSNHNALLDVPVTSPFIPSCNKTIGKISFMKIPIFNLYYERGGVFIDRKSDASRRKGYEDMKKVLAQGMHMCIYPEGTRNKTNEPLQPFKDGAFRLAVETQTAIIPCLLFNTLKAMPKKPSFVYYPAKLEMHFLAPISPIGETRESLNAKVFEVMKNYYVANAR